MRGLDYEPISQTIDPVLAAHPEYGPLVERASRTLGGIAERTLFKTSARWGLDPASRSPIRVQFRDELDLSEHSFRPEQLKDEYDMQWRMTRLWGDILERRSELLLEQLIAQSDEEK